MTVSQLMAHTRLSIYLKKAGDSLLVDECPYFGMILRVFGGWRRDGMVKRDGETVRIFDPGMRQLFKDAGNGGCIVMAQHDIGFDHNHIIGLRRRLAACAGQNFFS